MPVQSTDLDFVELFANAKHVVIVQVLTHFSIGPKFWCSQLCTIGHHCRRCKRCTDNCANKKRRFGWPHGNHALGSAQIFLIPRHPVCKTADWTLTISSKISVGSQFFFVEQKDSIKMKSIFRHRNPSNRGPVFEMRPNLARNAYKPHSVFHNFGEKKIVYF